MKLTHAERSYAYARLTRELRIMHFTERNILDTDPSLEVILTAVHEGRDEDALALAAHIHTERGDAWRAKFAA